MGTIDDDLYGALTLPALVPDEGASVADPALAYLLSFLQTVANARGRKAWAAVATADSRPVIGTFTHDPAKCGFSEEDLPALYLIRDGGHDEQWADDIRIERAQLKLLWIFPHPGGAENQILRNDFANFIGKVIDAALVRQRDPSWFVDGDTEPQALAAGSFLQNWAGYSQINVTGRWSPYTLSIAIEGSEPRQYEGIQRTFEMLEQFAPGADEPLHGISGTITSGGDDPRTTVPFQLDPP